MVRDIYGKTLLSLLCALTIGTTGIVTAQDRPATTEEFIYFVNGPNVLIPNANIEVVNDPLDPGSGNLVAKINYSGWAETGFEWDPAAGVDMSANFPEVAGQGPKLYFKLLVSSENAGRALKLVFFDKTDGSSMAREEAEAADPKPDYRTRMNWTIPETMRNDTWHDVAISMPPRTIAALDSAKADKMPDGTPLDMPLDSLSKLWTYGGAWSNGAFGVACCGSAYDADPSTDPLFAEHEFDAVAGFYVHFDNADGGGAVYFDDLYIGYESTDLSSAVDPPAAQSNISLVADGGTNVIQWTGSDDLGGYNVYAAEEAITDVNAEGVLSLATVAFDAGDAQSFEIRHNFKSPHPNLAAGNELFYAVSSTSLFGVENTDVSASSSSLVNDLDSNPFIQMLTEDQADAIFANLENGLVSGEGFPEGMQPFVIEECAVEITVFGPCPSGEQVSWTDAGAPPTDGADNSGRFWIGMTSDAELFAYAEINDDVLEPTPEAETGGEAWQHDSIEYTLGSYEVSALVGSDHLDMLRGDAPDHQLRVAFHTDANGDIFTSSWESNSLGSGAGGDIVGALSAFDSTDTGWAMLSYIPLAQIVGAESGDVIFEPPAEDEIKLIPFSIGVNDGDGGGRESQINWSTKLNVNNQWWNTPAQWLTVAVAGQAVATSAEDVGDVPREFALEQNYPNPFNPATSIRFSLPLSEKVTLSVYNVLGHKVATLVDGERMSAGQHDLSFDAGDLASGMYIYRLEAGAEFVQTRRMLLVK